MIKTYYLKIILFYEHRFTDKSHIFQIFNVIDLCTIKIINYQMLPPYKYIMQCKFNGKY